MKHYSVFPPGEKNLRQQTGSQVHYRLTMMLLPCASTLSYWSLCSLQLVLPAHCQEEAQIFVGP